MFRPNPAGFMSSNTVLSELAHQLRQFPGRPGIESDGQIDAVGQVNFAVLLEALVDDRRKLSPTDAQCYCREVLAVRDPHNADLYKKAARILSRRQRSVATPGQEKNDARQRTYDAFRAAAEKDLSDWRKAQQTAASPPLSGDGPGVEPHERNAGVQEPADAAQPGHGVLCPQCQAPMQAIANGWRCSRSHGEDGMMTWTG